MSDAPEIKPISPAEKTRTYVYPDGSKLTYENVIGLCVRPSGSHRLELGDGRKVIVIPGWRAVELDVSSWTF